MKLVLAVAAMAALMSEAAAGEAPPLQNAYDWSGFYLGLQGGRADGSVDIFDGPSGNFGLFAGTYLFDLEPEGNLGGLLVGYNWQFDHLILGLEASLSTADLEEGGLSALGGINSVETDWLLTVGPRIGYAFDRLALYAEGGYAAAGMEFTHDNTFMGVFFNDTNVHHGVYLGAGADFALSDRVIVGAEYNFISLGDEIYRADTVPWDAELRDPEFHVVTARLAFKF